MPRGPLLHQRPAKALGIWLAIYCAYIIGYKWRTWLVRPVPPAFHVAALLLLFLPHLTSIIDIYVLRALHRVRAQLPVRHLRHVCMHVSPFDSRGTPGVFYKYFYNHTHRLRLEKTIISRAF